VNRHIVRLGIIGAVVLAAGLLALAIGGNATLAAVVTMTAVALSWPPVLLTLESMARERRDGRNRG
jgi:multidrug efflux pump subunit AcrA (membrane-fusion protein)